MKKNLFPILFALVLSLTAAAQETIFPTQFKAPAEFNTGDVHISVLSRSERQMTTRARPTIRKKASPSSCSAKAMW